MIEVNLSVPSNNPNKECPSQPLTVRVVDGYTIDWVFIDDWRRTVKMGTPDGLINVILTKLNEHFKDQYDAPNQDWALEYSSAFCTCLKLQKGHSWIVWNSPTKHYLTQRNVN